MKKFRLSAILAILFCVLFVTVLFVTMNTNIIILKTYGKVFSIIMLIATCISLCYWLKTYFRVSGILTWIFGLLTIVLFITSIRTEILNEDTTENNSMTFAVIFLVLTSIFFRIWLKYSYNNKHDEIQINKKEIVEKSNRIEKLDQEIQEMQKQLQSNKTL